MANELTRLVLPKPLLRRLESAGVYCQTWVTVERQARAERWILRAVESGGSAKEVGRYVAFFACDEPDYPGSKSSTALAGMVRMPWWSAKV